MRKSRTAKVFTSKDAEEALKASTGRVVIPADFTHIESGAFHSREDLLYIELPPAIVVEHNAFSGSGVASLVTSVGSFIGSEAFLGCDSLSNLIIAKDTKVKLSAFGGCTNLKNLFVSAGAELDDYAFESCDSLEDVIISADARCEADVFENCDGPFREATSNRRVLLSADLHDANACLGMGIFLECLRQADKSLLEYYLEELLRQGFEPRLQQYWRHLLLGSSVHRKQFAVRTGNFSSPTVIDWVQRMTDASKEHTECLNNYLEIPIAELENYKKDKKPEVPEVVRQGMEIVEDVLLRFASNKSRAFMSTLRKGGFFNIKRTNEEKSVDGAMLSSYSGMKQ